MKSIHGSLFFIIFLSIATMAQETKPQLLKEPSSWEFERFALPPGFAPGIPYKGVEELRFSPGMFKKDSATYFTYAFVAQLDSVTAISQTEIHDYLFKYFKGLCSGVAKDRKLVIDTANIDVTTEKKKGLPAGEHIYTGSLNIFGVFTDGAPVKLNAEVKVVKDMAGKKTYLVFIASPLEKTNANWIELYKIQKEFTMPK
jgi:hypothetical protein